MSTPEIRYLRFQVIEAHCHTGRLLDRVPAMLFSMVVTQHGMTLTHASGCVALYHDWHGCDWSRYELIDQWWRDIGHHSPYTPAQAVTMLRSWRARLD